MLDEAQAQAVPRHRSDPSPDADCVDLATHVRALADWWHEATDDLTSPVAKAQHPAYQQIIGLGWPAVPLILQELQERGGHWYAALRMITGASPVSPEAARDSRRVKALWVDWGKQNGLIT